MQSNFTHLILMSLVDRITSPHLSHANHADAFLIPLYSDAHGMGDYNAMVGCVTNSRVVPELCLPMQEPHPAEIM